MRITKERLFLFIIPSYVLILLAPMVLILPIDNRVSLFFRFLLTFYSGFNLGILWCRQIVLKNDRRKMIRDGDHRASIELQLQKKEDKESTEELKLQRRRKEDRDPPTLYGK